MGTGVSHARLSTHHAYGDHLELSCCRILDVVALREPAYIAWVGLLQAFNRAFVMPVGQCSCRTFRRLEYSKCEHGNRAHY